MKPISTITEAQFQQQVIDLAHYCGWKVAHFRPARVIKNGIETWRTAVSADGAGFLDLIMIRPPRLVIAELKSQKGKLSPEQQEWFRLWEECQKTFLLEPLELKQGKASVALKEGQKIITIPELYLWYPKDIEPESGIILETLR